MVSQAFIDIAWLRPPPPDIPHDDPHEARRLEFAGRRRPVSNARLEGDLRMTHADPFGAPLFFRSVEPRAELDRMRWVSEYQGCTKLTISLLMGSSGTDSMNDCDE